MMGTIAPFAARIAATASSRGQTRAPRRAAGPCLVAAMLIASPTTALAQRSLPPLESFELDNGLRVVLQPVPSRRHVSVVVTYDVGSRDVPRGYSGLAHLTEHLLFEGTDAAGSGLDALLEDAGVVERNGITTPDHTVLYELVPVAALERALWIEATRMAHTLARVDAQALETQRRVVLHEGRQRGRHGSIGRITSLLYEHLYHRDVAHPYRRVFEHEEDIGAIQLPHVQRFFQTRYGPDDATLSLAGGFDPATARAAIERYFGPIRRSGPRAPRPAAAPPRVMPFERRVTYDAHTQHDEIYVLWPTPAYREPGDAELDVLRQLLVGRTDAPLYRALRTSGLAVSVAVRQHSQALGSYFQVHAVAARGHHTGELLSVIDGVLDAMRDRAPDEQAVARARLEWETAFLLGTESLVSIARRHGTRVQGEVPTADAEIRRYRAVTRETVRDTLRDWLPPDRRLVFFVASHPRARPEGEVVSVRDVPPRRTR